MKSIYILLSLLVSGTVMASEGGVMSLIPAFVNVSILAFGLIYLLKDKASIFFSEKSSGVSEMMDRASAKAKEAEEMMAIQKSKILKLDDEIKALKDENEKLLNEFEKSYAAEVKDRIAKLKEDTENKVEAEKSELVNEINSNLLDLVVSNAKNKIKADSSLSQTATANLIKGL